MVNGSSAAGSGMLAVVDEQVGQGDGRKQEDTPKPHGLYGSSLEPDDYEYLFRRGLVDFFGRGSFRAGKVLCCVCARLLWIFEPTMDFEMRGNKPCFQVGRR